MVSLQGWRGRSCCGMDAYLMCWGSSRSVYFPPISMFMFDYTHCHVVWIAERCQIADIWIFCNDLAMGY
jgi:hypothetical protein